MSSVIHAIELWIWTLPGTPWILLVEILIFLLILGMVVAKVISLFSSNVLLSWSDHHPRFLRIIQSPIFYAAGLASLGLFYFHLKVLQLDPRARAWAAQAEQYAYWEAPLGEWDRLRRKAKKPPLALEKALNSWNKAWNSQETRDILKLPSLQPMDLPQESPREVAFAALNALQETRVFEGVSLLMAMVGFGGGLFLWTHERNRDGIKGGARWASRRQVLYHRSGYWSIPIRVLQRGNRNYAKVGSAPYTVARPAWTTHVVHMIVVGHSGSGKGKSLGAHIFRTCTVPIVYFDFKAELPGYRLRPRMRRWGFVAGKPKGLPSHRFNFIAWARNHEDPDTACKSLASTIIPANSKKESENQWIKDTAIPILAQGIQSGRWQNLAELADEVEHTPLPELLEHIEVGRGRLFNLEGKNAPQYAQNELSNNTQAFLSGRARHIVTGSDFTMEDVFRKGLYIMGQAASTYEKRVLQMMWAIFWFELLRKSEPLPLLVFIDEGIASGPIPNVQDALITLRDRRISLIQCFQYEQGVNTVYGPELGPSVVAAHQTHLWLTKGLSDPDITTLSSKAIKTYTHTKKTPSGDRNDAVFLLKEDEFKRHCRQEKYWAIIDGVGWTSDGAPIMAALVEAADESWSWTNTREAYEAAEQRLGYGTEFRSRFKMHKFQGEWRPVFPEEAAQLGLGSKPIQPAPDQGQVPPNSSDQSPTDPSESFGF